MKNKNQETDGYGRDKRPRTEKLKRKEITITENYKKTETEKPAVKHSGYYVWNGHGADSETLNVSARQAALNRWTATDRR